jgi:hypothetical protein
MVIYVLKGVRLSDQSVEDCYASVRVSLTVNSHLRSLLCVHMICIQLYHVSEEAHGSCGEDALALLFMFTRVQTTSIAHVHVPNMRSCICMIAAVPRQSQPHSPCDVHPA